MATRPPGLAFEGRRHWNRVSSPMEDEVRTREGLHRDQLRPRAAVIPELTPPASLSHHVIIISCPVKEAHPILQMTLNLREVPRAQAFKQEGQTGVWTWVHLLPSCQEGGPGGAGLGQADRI